MTISSTVPMTAGVERLRGLFLRHWSGDTSYRASGDWTPTNPSYGQCAITALKIQELLGGELLRIDIPGSGSHYANRINGGIVDLTADQFPAPIDYTGAEVRDRQQILSNATTAARYRIFSDGVDADLDAVLPVADIDHVAIRDARYVAGTDQRPEVGVFVQTRTRPPAINLAKLAARQRVWMKWNSGPVVAVSELLSWHAGEFAAGNVNNVRDRCVGTSLFGLDAYWKAVASKTVGAYCVLRLTNEAWLDLPLWPATRSYGSSWVYLDTLRKKVQWLAFGTAPPREAPAGRSIPAGLRFKVLRRDGYTCQYCGRRAPEVELHVDHRVPWSKVRVHDIDNLVTACRDCNLGKGTATVHAE
jgi:hypothetical protein